MGFGIVKITDLSGDACKIYSVARDDSEDTLLELFLDEFDSQYPKQIDEIINKLRFMGLEGGAREGFFRENEGKPGDGVVALLNAPHFPLRLSALITQRIKDKEITLASDGSIIGNKHFEEDL